MFITICLLVKCQIHLWHLSSSSQFHLPFSNLSLHSIWQSKASPAILGNAAFIFHLFSSFSKLQVCVEPFYCWNLLNLLHLCFQQDCKEYILCAFLIFQIGLMQFFILLPVVQLSCLLRIDPFLKKYSHILFCVPIGHQ